MPPLWWEEKPMSGSARDAWLRARVRELEAGNRRLTFKAEENYDPSGPACERLQAQREQLAQHFLNCQDCLDCLRESNPQLAEAIEKEGDDAK